MSMLIVTETHELWTFGHFCRSEHVQPVLPSAYGTNRAMDNQQARKDAGRWVTYIHVDGNPWRISIETDGRVSFLAHCDASKKSGHYVDSRYNTRAGVMALGRLLGVLLLILRAPGPARLPEVSFDPESPALGMAFRRMTQNPYVLKAFQREGFRLVGRSVEAIRFRRCTAGGEKTAEDLTGRKPP